MEVDDAVQVLGFQEKPESPRPLPGNPGRSRWAAWASTCSTRDFLYERAGRGRDEDDVGPRLRARPHPSSWRSEGRVLCASPARQHHAIGGLRRPTPYWRDVGTIDAFWEANLELTRVTPALNLYDDTWPIWTCPGAAAAGEVRLRPATAGAAPPSTRMVSGGCIISGSTVRNSMLFSNVRVHSYCDHQRMVLRCPRWKWAAARSSRACWSTRAPKIPAGLRAGVDIEEDRRRFHT